MIYDQNERKYNEILREVYNPTYYQRKSRKMDESVLSLSKNKILESSQGYSKTFQATRLVFNREKNMKGTLSKITYEQYLVKKVEKNQSIVIYEMKNSNFRNTKPFLVPMKDYQHCNSFEYDLQNKRLFYFDNSEKEVVGLGLKSKEVLFRIRARHERKDPAIYYHRTQEN